MTDDCAYDANGNLATDDLNKNIQMKYDHRNLMIENTNVLSLQTYRTYYRYDEAGNRINKKHYLYVNGTPPEYGDSIIVDEGDGSGYWSLVSNTFYVRDVSGRSPLAVSREQFEN